VLRSVVLRTACHTIGGFSGGIGVGGGVDSGVHQLVMESPQCS
jgi:hypothetical protein